MYKGLKERTLILIKPDGVKRGLIGEIINRFEKTGLKIVALKLVKPTVEHIDLHQPKDEEWIKGMGEKTLKNYQEYGINPKKEVGTDNPLEIGKMIRKWNSDFLTSGPVVAAVLEGNHAVSNVRMVAGNTLPVFATPGTIRGDYSVDSPALANAMKRAVKNVFHASGTVEEAEKEIGIWFSGEELHDYKRSDEDVMF